MNYEFNLLHHAGVVAKKVRAAAHEGDDNTPSGSTGRGAENRVRNYSVGNHTCIRVDRNNIVNGAVLNSIVIIEENQSEIS